MGADHKEWITNCLGVKEMDKFETYLGLPTLISRSKYQAFSFLKDRVWEKLQGWKGTMLSRAGKKVLIKTVAQSIPTYTMSVFQLPISYVTSLIQCVQIFGGVKWAMKEKYIGRVGVSCLNQRNKEGWDFKISGIIILQC